MTDGSKAVGVVVVVELIQPPFGSLADSQKAVY